MIVNYSAWEANCARIIAVYGKPVIFFVNYGTLGSLAKTAVINYSAMGSLKGGQTYLGARSTSVATDV